MYLRAINDIEDWNSSDIPTVEKLPITCLNCFTEDENEYSVFKVDSIDDKKALDSIALRLFSCSPKKWSQGFHLMILEKSILKKISSNISENPPFMGCIHANIEDVCYSDFKNLVEYTYDLYNGKKSSKKFVEYSFVTIANLFSNMSENEFNNYLESYSKDEKMKNKLKKSISEIFFKPPKKCPVFLKNS